MRGRTYFTTLLGATLLLIVAAAGAIVAADPYGHFATPAIPRFNAEKPFYANLGLRTTHALRLAGEPFDVIILGSSRVQQGIDPATAASAGERVYNAGLSGTNMVEVHRLGMHLLAHQTPQRILLGLDLLMFAPGRTVNADFHQSPLASVPRWRSAFLQNWSRQGLANGVRTLRANVEGQRAAWRLDGHNAKLGSGRGGVAPFEAELRKFATEQETWLSFDPRESSSDAERLALLAELTEAAAAQGVEVILFFNPVHPALAELRRQMGLESRFREWKRDVALIAAAAASRHGRNRMQLWDFSVCSEGFRQTGTGADDAATYWWDASHFKSSLGSLMVREMAGTEPPAFGRRLVPPATALTVVNRASGNKTACYDRLNGLVERVMRETAEERCVAGGPVWCDPGDEGG